MTEQLANLAQTQLAKALGIVSSGTSEVITVTTVTRFPTEGNFRINLGGGELGLVTAVTGSSWTTTRGVESTVPIAHSVGQIVTGVLTVAAIEAVVEQSASGDVAVEKTAREAADATLATSIGSEKTRAEGVEATKATTTALTTEATARTSGDATNAAAITTEKGRAETAEATKASTTALTAETSAREGGDATNATAISTEKSRAETAEALKAPLASPALTGVPTVPTATAGTNTTQAASTAFATASKGEAESAATTAVGTEKTRAETAENLRLSAASAATAAAQVPIAESTSRAIKFQSKIVFDARDYGVTVNEGTDATTALQNAINAASTAKGAVEMPAGTIRLASALTIKSNVELRGQGAMTLLEPVYAEANHAAVITNELETGNSNITLRNFRLSRAGSNVQHGILLNGVSNLNVDGVEIVGVPSVTSGALAVSGVLPGGSGATLQVSKDVRVRDCLFESANNFGVQLSYVTNATVTGCVFDNCYREAVGVEPQTGCTATNVSITGNTFTTGTVPSGGSATGVIVVTTSSGGTLAGVSVSGNTLTNTIFTATNTQPGINVLGINGDSKVTITANMIVGMNGNGISIGNASIATGGVVISGNYISQCNEGKSIEFSGAGISLRQAFRCTITGNYIDGNHHTASIYESQSGAGRNLIIANHLLDTVAMTLLASGNTIARDNYGKATGSGGRLPVAANYTMLVTDTLIAVTSTSAAREITALAANAVPAGVVYTITDESNGAATNSITFKCAGADTFTDGTKEKVINKNNGSLKFYSTGTSWQLSTGETPSAELEEGLLKESQIPQSVLASSTIIDICKKYGAAPGKDITTEIQKGIEAVVALGGGTVYLSKPGVYNLEGAVKEAETAGYKHAGQVLFPANAEAGGQIPVRILGPMAPARVWFGAAEPGEGATPQGAVIRSNATSGFMFDAIASYEANTHPWTNLQVTFENIVLQSPNNPEVGGISCAAVQSMELRNVSVRVNAGERSIHFPEHTATAVICPKIGNNTLVRLTNVEICGFQRGLNHSEHAYLDGVSINRCSRAIEPHGAGGHASTYNKVLIQECVTPIFAEDTTTTTIYGNIDTEVATTGSFALENMITDEHNTLRGFLTIYCDTSPEKGWPIKGPLGSLELDIANTFYGAVPTYTSYPYDTFTRLIYGTKIGTCDKTSHTWFVREGAAEIAAGELKSKESAASTQALISYFMRSGGGSRTMLTKIVTGNAGYNMQLVLNRTFKSPEDYIAVKVSGGKVIILNPGLSTVAESAAAVVTEKTEYTLAVNLQQPVVGKSIVTAYVNGAEVVKYELTATDLTNLAENAGETRKRDGVRWVNDTTSVLKSFQMIPESVPGRLIPLEQGRSAEMVAGKITIAAPAVTSTGAIIISTEGTTMTVAPAVTARSAGTGFTVEAAATSTDRINWIVYAP